MEPVIEVRGLVKSFGSVRALDGVDLVVAPGETHGFLGPNGAGKSTTIRVLLGLLRPDAGAARVLGGDPMRDAVAIHQRLAYVPGDVVLWPNITGGETIDLFARLRPGADRARRDELIDRFELDPTRAGGTYSKGNRQKVAIVAALSCNADVLVFDEPTSGLDPLMEAEFAQCIREEQSEGRSILLSSHTLPQVDKLCETISIIRAGRIVESGRLDDLRHLTRSTVRAQTRIPADDIARRQGVHDLRVDGGGVLAMRVDHEALDGVIGELHEHGIITLECQPPTLEEIFLRHYERQDEAHR